MKRSVRLQILAACLIAAGVIVACLWAVVAMLESSTLPANGAWLISVLLLAAAVLVILLEMRVSLDERNRARHVRG